jgi:hypothetical protein
VRKPKKKLAIVNGIPCKNCKKVEVGHNAANCGGTAEERAAAARGVKKP